MKENEQNITNQLKMRHSDLIEQQHKILDEYVNKAKDELKVLVGSIQFIDEHGHYFLEEGPYVGTDKYGVEVYFDAVSSTFKIMNSSIQYTNEEIIDNELFLEACNVLYDYEEYHKRFNEHFKSLINRLELEILQVDPKSDQ